MPVADDLIARNREYAASYTPSLPLAPARRLAVVACMDSRLAVFGALGLELGEAHVIRNAGGLVTDDVIRSLAISQRLLGTRSVLVIQHTDCGLLKVTDDEFARSVEEDTGRVPPWRALAFPDVEASVRDGVRRLRADPFVPHVGEVRGFVFEIETGLLREIA